jgi:hypothetical protein
MSMDELANVKGRGWEDIDVRGPTLFFCWLERWALLTPIIALIHGVIDRRGRRREVICTCAVAQLGFLKIANTSMAAACGLELGECTEHISLGYR